MDTLVQACGNAVLTPASWGLAAFVIGTRAARPLKHIAPGGIGGTVDGDRAVLLRFDIALQDQFAGGFNTAVGLLGQNPLGLRGDLGDQLTIGLAISRGSH